MISPKERQNFFSVLDELGIPSSYPSLICLYKLLSHVISICADNRTKILSTVFYPRFKYDPAPVRKFPDASMIAEKLASPKILDLCGVMYSHDLHNDYTRFFSAFVPAMVADWHTLRRLDSKELPILDVLFWHFTVTAGITGCDELFHHCSDDYYDQVHQFLPLLQPGDYEQIWDAVTYHACAEPDMHSRRVAKAVHLYANHGKSKLDLLEAYLLEQRDLGKKPICYSDLSDHERKKVAIEKIPSDEDVNYYTAPRYVNSELSEKTVANLYDYSKDIPFGEAVVAFDIFASRLHTAKAPLMINPNPHILNVWRLLSQKDAMLPQLSVAMPSRGIALALSRRYPQVQFYGVEELKAEPLTADLVLLYGTDRKKKERNTQKAKRAKQAQEMNETSTKITDLIDCICLTETCELVACINTHAMTAKDPNLCATLSSKGWQVSNVINIPAAKGLKGRLKKTSTTCVVAGAVPSVDTEAQIPVFSCMTTEARDYIAVLPDPIYVPLAHFNRGKTLSQILTEHVGVSTDNDTTNNRAKPIPWSKEIIIRYSVYDGSTEKETYVRGKAYVQKMDATDPKGYRKAIPMTQTEKGLRAKSEGDLIKKLMALPFKEEFYQPVLDEIIRIYGNCPELLTIKTVWFCLRPLLNKKSYYDDDLAKQLFCGESQALANLAFDALYEEYCDAFATVLGTNAVSMRHWAVLWQISEEAVENGFLVKDPFATFMPAIEATTRQKVYPIQEALRKWTFNDDEMNRMVQPLLERLPSGHALFEVDSHAFFKLCALFSLVRKAELCGLTVGDIELLPNGGAQATITKIVDDDGKVHEYAQRGRNRRRRRKSAWPPFLAECFKRRLKYLQEQFGWSNEAMQGMPLFFEKEPSCKNSKVKLCSLKTANSLLQELLGFANVPEDWIQLLDGKQARDVNLGLSRKIESNFINSTRILSAFYGLEDGEVSYNAGTEPEMTIDTNYIGYDAPGNQIRTSAKMHRMSAKFLRQIVPSVSPVPQRYTPKVNDAVCNEVVEPPADKCVRLAVEILPESDTFHGPITVRIQSRFGHRTHATVFGGNSHD